MIDVFLSGSIICNETNPVVKKSTSEQIILDMEYLATVAIAF
jgi:hypothetical protein